MSAIHPETHVSTLVLEQPGRARVFEQFEIDYCCGGNVPLAAACEDRGLELGVVLAALAESRSEGAEDADWASASLGELCTHIVEHHHAYLRDELPRLRELTAKVSLAHGDVHPELADVKTTLDALAEELELHMVKEEQVLFPACVALEHGASGFVFGSVRSPIGAMVDEHDDVADALARLRTLTHAYEPPADACNSYRAMLARLQTLELDTHRHIHDENNILFPRAIALEAR